MKKYFFINLGGMLGFTILSIPNNIFLRSLGEPKYPKNVQRAFGGPKAPSKLKLLIVSSHKIYYRSLHFLKYLPTPPPPPVGPKPHFPPLCNKD